MLFKKLFRLLVVGGAVAAAQTGCATTGSSAKSGDANATAASADKKADGDGTAAEPKTDKTSTESSGGGGVMGW